MPHLQRLLVISFVTLICWAGPLTGQDTLLIKTESGKVTKRTGTIVGWTGQQIQLSNNDRLKNIDAASVTGIETNWPGELNEARQLAASGKFSEAITKLQAAANKEDRDWVTAIITSELVQCFDAADNPTAATLEFLKLYSADPQTRFFQLIPLPWTTASSIAPNETDTEKWIHSQTSLLRLLGASWRLSGPDRTEATSVLEELSVDEDSRIAQLASAQLWRTQVVNARESDVDRWSRQLTRIPSELRAGPLAVLADAQQRIGQATQAKISLMKIPILYSGKKSLSAYALFTSGRILEDEGAAEKAAIIYRELMRDFPDSQYSMLVRQK